ncbi:MAG: glycosyltransferase family 4 protein [Firmicutes bacterium]|nr:glycosyltransferase family 4 protein [Bacillota bacterium]
MEIGIDARAAIWYRGSGIGTYTYQLVRGLLAIDLLNNYHLVYPPARWMEVHGDFQLMAGESKNRGFWQDVQAAPDFEEFGLDLYHVPQNGIGLPPSRPRYLKTVVTIHDLIPLVLPQTCSKTYLRMALQELPQIVEEADYIIAASFHTKEDLIRILGVREDKIAVIYEAAEPIYKPMCHETARTYVREQMGILGPYILNVGGFSRRKNLMGLVRSFRETLTELPTGCQLVLVGGGGGGSYEELRLLVDEWGLDKRVLFPGFVPLESMPYLYSGAELFVYPSLYEGFGLPPLEAMACGVPVVASNASSIPEVVGRGGLLYDPYGTDSLSEAILRVMGDELLKGLLAERGLEQSARFSWPKAAMETWMVYQSLA